MELTQINNTQFPMVQNDTVSINATTLEKVNSSNTNKLKSDIVETTSHSNSFLVNVTSGIQQISKLHTLQNETTSQLEMVKNFGQLVSKVATNSIDDYQGDIQSFINTFNTRSQTSTERIEMIIEEKQSEESRTYFDGILGSKPLSQEEILQAVEEQQKRLEFVNKALNDEIIKTKQEVQSTFDLEKEKSTSNSTFSSSVDFEQESKTFTKDSFKEFSSAMVETQTNVEPIVGEKLLAS